MVSLIEKEIDQMNIEFETMIHTQLPELVKNLNKELNTPFISGILRKSGLPPPQKINLPFELEDNPNIKGNITISASSIEQMDLIAQMNVFNRKHLFQIFLTKGQKYRLQQLNLIEIYMSKLIDMLEPDLIVETYYDANKYIDGIINKLKQILKQFQSPDKQFIFPNHSCDPKIITPELPNDLIIQYYIIDAEIIIELIHFKPITDTSSSSSFSLTNTLKRSTTPPDKIISTYQNQSIELLEKMAVKVHHPNLKLLKTNLNNCLNDWIQFSENLSVFNENEFC